MAYDPNIRRLPDPYFNNGIGFVSAALTNVTVGTSADLNSGIQVSSRFQGDYWEIRISYPQTTQDELDTVLPFLEYIAGTFQDFYVQLPQHANPKSGAWDDSTPALVATGEISLVTPNTISIAGWSTRGGDLDVGDMIKFTNMSKIFKILSKSVVADVATFELNSDIKYPSLIGVAGLEPNNILFRVTSKQRKISTPELTTNGLYSGFSLTLRENPK